MTASEGCRLSINVIEGCNGTNDQSKDQSQNDSAQSYAAARVFNLTLNIGIRLGIDPSPLLAYLVQKSGSSSYFALSGVSSASS